MYDKKYRKVIPRFHQNKKKYKNILLKEEKISSIKETNN